MNPLFSWIFSLIDPEKNIDEAVLNDIKLISQDSSQYLEEEQNIISQALQKCVNLDFEKLKKMIQKNPSDDLPFIDIILSPIYQSEKLNPSQFVKIFHTLTFSKNIHIDIIQIILDNLTEAKISSL